jgi:hypothetical protein
MPVVYSAPAPLTIGIKLGNGEGNGAHLVQLSHTRSRPRC